MYQGRKTQFYKYDSSPIKYLSLGFDKFILIHLGIEKRMSPRILWRKKGKERNYFCYKILSKIFKSIFI